MRKIPANTKAKKRPLIYRVFIWVLLIIQYAQVLSPIVYAVDDATPSATLATPLPASDSASVATSSGEINDASPSALPSSSPLATSAAEITPELSPSPVSTMEALPLLSPSPSSSALATSTPHSSQTTQTSTTTLPPILSPLTFRLSYPFSGHYPLSFNFGESSDDLFVSRMQSLFGVVAHDGIDFPMAEGTPILAADSGTVVHAGPGEYGETLTIQHDWGRSYYGHLSQILVSVGDKIETGKIIAYSGNTGVSTAPHLHFGIIPNKPNLSNGYHGFIDPSPYLNVTTQVLGTKRGWQRKFKFSHNTLRGSERNLSLNFINAQSRGLSFELTYPDQHTENVTSTILDAGLGPLAPDLNLDLSRLEVNAPGKYTLTATDESGNFDQQDFSWGVLALNPNQSVYVPGDTAKFAFAVLDDQGHPVCDADLSLSVVAPSGATYSLSSKNGRIQVNSKVCKSYEFTLQPDYEGELKLAEIGTYQLSLNAITNNGDYNIKDQLRVSVDEPFYIERTTITRVYPANIYPVTLHVKSNLDYQGTVTESIPSGFTTSGETSWNVDWHQGETYALSYYFDAPDASPAYFALGPLTIGDYVEPRAWSLAIDASSTNATVWYLHATTASSAFSTTGPTAEQSTATDLVSGSPASKTPALSMTDAIGTSQTSVAGTETSVTAGNMWFRTFLSPKLAGQTITSGTTFRFESALAENNTGANMIYRIHVYQWREGTGFIASLIDNVAATACGGEPGAANSERNEVCVTAGTGSNATITAGDQLALEVWVNANNTVTTSYTGTMYFDGNGFIEQGVANNGTVISSAASRLSVSKTITLQTASYNTTTWYLHATTASSAFSTTGPTTEQSSASDLVSGSPTSKSTALSMTDAVGTSQTSVTGTETSASAGNIWYRTYLSPLLDAQTIATGTIFRFEAGLAESSLSANNNYRIHVYQWREGTGYIASLVDGVGAAANCGGEPGAITSERNETCLTAGTGSDITLNSGDQIALEVWVFANNTSTTSFTGTHYFDGTGFIGQGVANNGTVISSAASNLSISQTLLLKPASITISGTANGNNGATVKLAVNNSLQGQTGTISGGNWSISSVTTPATGAVVTVWVDSVGDSNESTGVTKYYSGTTLSGMVLDTNVLSIGSGSQSLTLTNLDQYDCSQNEDIMHQAGSSILKVEGDSCNGSVTNSYTAEKINILSGDTLTISGSETLTTYDLTITGTLTSGGNSTYNVSHDWAEVGTFTQSTSTVNLNGGGGTTQTITGTNTFYNLSATGSSARTIKFPSSVTTTISNSLTLTGASSQLLTLDPGTASTVWTISIPTTNSISYVSVSYSTNSGATFCTIYSTNGGNNTGWNITASATCPSDADTNNSFQRKTWYDGTRYWRSYQDITDSRIEFEYSTDGSTWAEDTSARISTNTPDYSVWADSSAAYLAYKTSAVTNQDNLLQSSNLKAYWKMNESSWNGTSGEVIDDSGNSLHGTRAGNATTTSSGKFNNAGTFDGFDDYVSVADPGTNSALDFANGSTISISAWIYPTSMPGTNTWQAIVSKGGTDNTDDINYLLQIGNSSGTDVITLCFSSSAVYQCWNGSGMDLVVNTWQQIGVKFTYGTASSIRTYHNGTEYSSGSWGSGTGSGAPDVTNKDLWIGADDYSDGNVSPQEEFFGRIDDLRIYDTGLSAAQMATLGQPGYDIEVRKASSYPGTGFTWGNPTVALNGLSSTAIYKYPSLTQDSASKIWVSGTYNDSDVTINFDAVRSTNASDITTWDAASSLVSGSINTNTYGVLVPRTSNNMQAVYIDGTAISSQNYTSGSWDGSPASIATGSSGLTTTLSAVSDSSGNIHLIYISSGGNTIYREYTTSWQTGVTLDSNSSNTYPTLSLNSANSDLYAFWIRSNHIYYKKGVSTYASGNWDASATDWQTTGTNTKLTSNYSNSSQIFAEWLDGTTITWNKLTLSGNTSPNSPSSLVQKTVGDVTISTGGWNNATSIKFVATATDPDASDTLYLCVEKDLLGVSFGNTEDSCGTGVAYSGSGVTVSVTISGQTDASEYHWQARLKDSAGAYSSWVSYDVNAESARDYGLDTTAPTGGTVYDGTSVGVDATYNDGSLSSLSANWASFDSNASGLNKYQYSIGTSAGATDIKTWTDNSTTTSVTASGLTLNSSTVYYFNVRAVDNAGNTGSTVSSNGQRIAPSLSFSVGSSSIAFANLNATNSFTDSKTSTVTTSTNAYNGYVVRAFVTDYLRSTVGSFTIPDFTGGTYASPATWGSSTGFGYTSNDTTIGGSNKFSSGTLYAPFNHTGPGDIVADHTSTVSGTSISNEQFTLTYKVTAPTLQEAKNYATTVVYTATAQY